jgi:hypothetical protein
MLLDIGFRLLFDETSQVTDILVEDISLPSLD